MIAKPGLDGHDRGAKIIARALRDAGMEVIYTGLHQTPEQIVETAIQEDADAVGISILSGAHMTLVPRILEGLRENEAEDVLVVVGGTIPADDAAELKKLGVGEVFTPGTPTAEIVEFLRGRVGTRGLTVALDRDGAVAVVTIDRPEAMNALDVPTLSSLREVLLGLREDDDVRAIVLTGAGDRAFAAGADIKYMSGLDPAGAKNWGELGHTVGQLLETSPQPDDRRGQRLRAGRRLRARARVRHPLRIEDGEARPARDQPGDHPGLGRHAAPRARLRPRRREGADPHRADRGRGGGAPDRPGQRRLRAGRAARARARDGAR